MTRMSSIVSRPLAGLLTCFGLLTAAWAQSPSASVPPAQPSIGEILTDEVRVRAGPNTNYYEVCRLNRGTHVRIVARQHGWIGIAPPEGLFSLINRDHVRLRPDGTGEVTAGSIAVRAGSLLSDAADAPQVRLTQGQTVRIVGEQGPYFRIAPPAGAMVWLNEQFVGPVGSSTLPDASEADTVPPSGQATASLPDPEPLAELPPGRAIEPLEEPSLFQTLPPSPTTQPLSRSPTGLDNNPPLPPAPAMQPEMTAVPATQPASVRDEARLEELEAQFLEIAARPVREQEFTPVEAGYRELAESQSDFVRQVAQLRLSGIQRSRSIQALLDEAASIPATAAPSPAVIAATSIIESNLPRAEHRFVAAGRLESSQVFQRRFSQRYRLVDPANGLTVAYVELREPERVDLSRLLGMIIGVSGPVELLPGTGVRIIYADRVELLAEMPTAMGRPRLVEPSQPVQVRPADAAPSAIRPQRPSTAQAPSTTNR